MPDGHALKLATGGMLQYENESKTLAAMPDEAVMEQQAADMNEAIASLKARTGRTEFALDEVYDELSRLDREGA